MNREIQILLIVTAGVSSFSSHNSTPVIGSEHLLKPIVIPNVTRYFEGPQTKNGTGPVEEKDSDPQKPEPTTLSENYSDEESTVSENSVRFSSRYSTKGKDGGRAGQISESAGKNDEELGSVESQEIGNRRSFSDRSDEVDSSEEEKEDVGEYFDTNESEEWKVGATTNEPSLDSTRPTSLRRSPEQDFKDYEIASSSEEEEEEEKEKKNNTEEAEEKRSVDVYHNSGSKNYHSVQTPLSNIRYRGPHSVKENFDSEKIRTRPIDPIRRPPTGHKWPYFRSQTKSELENTNEVSDSEDNSLDEGIRKELEKNPRIAGLELAVKKDEERFDEKRKYNIVKERLRGKQKAENLAAEEEKDYRRLPFRIQKQYQVDEEPRYQPSIKTFPKKVLSEGSPMNIFKDKPKQHTKFDISQELAPALQAHHLLGPVVFSFNRDEKKGKVAEKAHIANKAIAKGLLDREKLDRDNLTNERIQETTGNADYTSTAFNHLEESEEMYNAILANIQSVFGLRKSNGGSSRSRQEESRSLTWTLPLEKH